MMEKPESLSVVFGKRRDEGKSGFRLNYKGG